MRDALRLSIDLSRMHDFIEAAHDGVARPEEYEQALRWLQELSDALFEFERIDQ